MTDSSSTPRYSEREMALILKRAAELQEGAEGESTPVSLNQIQEIAAEAGIGPAYVSEAAAELERPMPQVGWLGAPTRFHDERKLDATLSRTAVGELVDAARSALGLHGEVQEVLDTVEWRARSPLGLTIVTVSPREGKTRIAVTIARGDHAALVTLGSVGIGILGALGGVVLAINGTDSALVASGIIAGSGVVATLLSARLMWASVARRWRRTAKHVVELLAERARQLA
jgi:hypothetical protein